MKMRVRAPLGCCDGIYPERSRRVPVDEINATLYFLSLSFRSADS